MHCKYNMIYMEIQSEIVCINCEQQIYSASITSKAIQKQLNICTIGQSRKDNINCTIQQFAPQIVPSSRTLKYSDFEGK